MGDAKNGSPGLSLSAEIGILQNLIDHKGFKDEAGVEQAALDAIKKRLALLPPFLEKATSEFTPDLLAMRHRGLCMGAFENHPCTCGLRRARELLKQVGK